MMLRNLSPAPDFTLRDEHRQEHTLLKLRGQEPLVMVFFRGAFCLTTRRDILNYADNYDRIRMVGAKMVAISVDTPETLRALREQLGLPFTLLSDPGFTVSERYGVYRSDETDEGPQPHGEPAVFILDVDGNLAYSQVQTGPKGAASPADIILILLYMAGNEGRYW